MSVNFRLWDARTLVSAAFPHQLLCSIHLIISILFYFLAKMIRPGNYKASTPNTNVRENASKGSEKPMTNLTFIVGLLVDVDGNLYVQMK